MAKKLNRKTKISKDELRNSIKTRISGGVSTILPGGNVDEAIAQNPEQVIRDLSHTVADIAIKQIKRNPEQPRVDFDEASLRELSESLQQHGLIQPITVRRMGPDSYQLISGERRWRAAQLAGLEQLPAYVRVVDNDQQLLELALIENIQREDLNAIEVAITLQRLKEECEITDEELAKRLGKGRATITNHLRLLRLPPDVQQSVKDREISMGHARALAGIEDIAIRQILYQRAKNEGISVRKLEELIASYKAPASSATAKKTYTLPDAYEDVQQRLRHQLGSRKVSLKLKSEGKGQIVIPFQTVDELNDLLERIEDGQA